MSHGHRLTGPLGQVYPDIVPAIVLRRGERPHRAIAEELGVDLAQGPGESVALAHRIGVGIFACA
jgi:NAD-dependent oxidoreductase involved in siderophore biosynthesis